MKRTEGRYARYLKGKTVALVGPAQYLQGRITGRTIDNRDIVVRVNHVIPVPDKKDYGSRTDVLYHGVWNAFRKRKQKKLIQELRGIEKCVQWVVFRNSEWQAATVRKITPYLGTPWTVIEPEYHDLFKKICPPRGTVNTGVAAIIHLLSFDIESLSVYGFDFYQTGVFDGHGDPEENQSTQERNENSHDTGAQIEYLSRLNDERFLPDNELDAVLKGSAVC